MATTVPDFDCELEELAWWELEFLAPANNWRIDLYAPGSFNSFAWSTAAVNPYDTTALTFTVTSPVTTTVGEIAVTSPAGYTTVQRVSNLHVRSGDTVAVAYEYNITVA